MKKVLGPFRALLVFCRARTTVIITHSVNLQCICLYLSIFLSVSLSQSLSLCVYIYIYIYIYIYMYMCVCVCVCVCIYVYIYMCMYKRLAHLEMRYLDETYQKQILFWAVSVLVLVLV